MSAFTILRSTGDATLRRYTRSFDKLTLTLKLWDESELEVQASGVAALFDDGTWEVDAIVRLPELDAGDLQGFGLVDTDGTPTLRFTAEALSLDRSVESG